MTSVRSGAFSNSGYVIAMAVVASCVVRRS